MSKKVAILQSNYIPWKGYFDLINLVDEFIIYDDMQYTRRDWRNRNKIKTPNGLQWLSIAVDAKGKFEQKICETKINDPKWGEAHWKSICQNYTKAPYFKDYREVFESLFLNTKTDLLSNVNFEFIKAICEILEIETKLSWSMDYSVADGKTERLADLCKQAGGSYYLSGPAAKDYIDDKVFADLGIELAYMDYSGYPEYKQVFGEFEHGVTILDLLFNTGPDAKKYMKTF